MNATATAGTSRPDPVPYDPNDATPRENALRAELYGRVVTDRHGHTFRVDTLTHNHLTGGPSRDYVLLTNNWTVEGRIITPAPQADLHPRDHKRSDDWTYLTFGYYDVPDHHA